MFVELERLLSLRRWLERRPPRRHLAAHCLTSVSPSQAGSKYQHQFILFLWIDPFFPAWRDYSQIPLRKRSLHIKYHLEILVYYWNLLKNLLNLFTFGSLEKLWWVSPGQSEAQGLKSEGAKGRRWRGQEEEGQGGQGAKGWGEMDGDIPSIP